MNRFKVSEVHYILCLIVKKHICVLSSFLEIVVKSYVLYHFLTMVIKLSRSLFPKIEMRRPMLCITVKQTTVLTQVISVKNLLLFVLFLYDKIKPFIKTLNRNFCLYPCNF